jgi:4-amino-4-deoxy-L-arabinose transferase-like glycosyltransferase
MRPAKWTLLAIVVAAVAVRVIYYAQLSTSGAAPGSGGALLQLHRWDQSDMHFFDAWARLITSGDVLTNQSLHPLHDWHVAVAQAHLGGDATIEQVRAAWDDWYGGKRFHQEPLYPYLIALTYATLGDDVRWVFLWQMAMGVASTMLVYRIGRRCFGEAAGLVAAALTVPAGPLIFNELVLLRGPVITFLGLLAVDAAGVALERKTWKWWLAAGAAGGLAMLAHGGAQLLIPAVMLTAWASRGIARPHAAAAVLAGVILALSPAMARNLIVGVAPLQLSSVGAVTFIATNGPDQHADMSFYASAAIPQILEAARAGGPGVVTRTIAMHDGIGAYAGLVGRKIAMTWRWFEKPNNVSFAYFAKHAWVLHLMPVRFALVAPLATVGLAILIAGYRRRVFELLPLLTLMASGVLSSIVAAPHARYRAPLVAWLAPLAGLGLVWLVREARHRAASRPWIAAVATVVVLFVLTLRPLPYGVTAITNADWLSPYRAYWLPQQEAAATPAEAAAVLDTAFAFRPPVIDDLSRQRPAATPDEADLARFYAAVYARYGQALRDAGQTQKALAAERRSMDLLESAAAFEVHR